MKIYINYDMIDYVKNTNTPLGPFKVARDIKKGWLKRDLPIMSCLGLITLRDIKGVVALLAMQFTCSVFIQLSIQKSKGVDAINNKSEFYLKKLVPKLQDINIETDYELLKKATLDSKKYTVRLNENKLPEIVQSKYIVVPSYGYNGQIKDSSILQEHVLGSSKYELSSGTPKRKVKRMYLTEV